MKIIVVGLGSMGRRRIRLINKYNQDYSIIGIDLNEERRRISNDEFGIETRGSLDEVIEEGEVDCAFICTSPLSHHKIIEKCLQGNLHVFTELNLVEDGYDENILLAKDNDRVLFLSSTFLYRAEIQKIDEIVKNQSKPLNYTYHIGQYLPDWHPWEAYKDFFVGNKRTNGCREIFAIELPWLMRTFGDVKRIMVSKSKISDLHVDYNDNYFVMVEHESGHKGMLAVDVVSRKAVRNLEVFGEDVYLSWDGSAEGLKILNLETKKEETIKLYEEIDQLELYSKFVVENAYYSEIESFFKAIEHQGDLFYSFDEDKKVLRLIDEIEAEDEKII